MLTDADSALLEAIGSAMANEVFKFPPRALLEASPDLTCADRSDVCRQVAESLDIRFTREDIRNRWAYVRTALGDSNTNPANLIGWTAYVTLRQRSGFWEDT